MRSSARSIPRTSASPRPCGRRARSARIGRISRISLTTTSTPTSRPSCRAESRRPSMGLRFESTNRRGCLASEAPSASLTDYQTTPRRHMLEQVKTRPSPLGDAIHVENDRVTVVREADLTSPKMDALVREAVFETGEARDYARWLIWEIGEAVGVRPASINGLYMARGKGLVHGFTVPAINVRGASYDTARAIFRTAIRMNAGAFLLEIARSEIAYTDQRPAEYVAVMLAAALREGFRGPVFIQGDHFQVNHKKFAADAATEVGAVKALAKEAIAAGFYNIDIDTSTLVDISKKSLDEQQRLNYEVGIDILRTVRELQPKGVVVSVGGEIGEVGTNNSTVEELRAYMDGFKRNLPSGVAGLSKISVQSGTSHGGVVLPDGSIADVKLDLDTLE